MGFNIKAMGPQKNARTQQSYFPINESSKYKGKLPVVCRSSWEKRLCGWLVANPKVVWWSSEAFAIPYTGIDGRPHSYYPDFIAQLLDGPIIVCEVKPKYQLVPPNVPKRKTAKAVRQYNRDLDTYHTNMLKFAAAKEYVAARGWRYLLVTEDFFQPTFKG